METTAIAVPAQTAEAQVVAIRPSIESALRYACQNLAEQAMLDRFEIAVKSRIERGINDDNDLRQADELLANVARNGDAVQALTRPAIKAADELHDRLLDIEKEYVTYVAKTKTWGGRWGDLREALVRAILKYKRDKEDLARRQQQELERAAEAERRRKEAEAREALRNGDMSEVKRVMEEARTIVAPVIMQATPILDSAQDRKEWVIEITDMMKVVRGVAAGTIPLSAIKGLDETFFKNEAKKRGGLPAEWEGVTATQRAAISVRR